MPRAKIKSIEEVDPIIGNAFRKAFASPGQRVVVVEGVAPEVARNLQVRMQAVRQGFVSFYPEEHEWHRAAVCNRLRIEREYDSKMPAMRTLTIRYAGMIKRPSEEAAEWLASLIEKGK